MFASSSHSKPAVNSVQTAALTAANSLTNAAELFAMATNSRVQTAIASAEVVVIAATAVIVIGTNFAANSRKPSSSSQSFFS